jgi:TIR domain
MSAIFVSYRRSDSLSVTGHLADDLERRFGREQLFRDIEAIEAGANFERAILDALRAATVILAVIGRTWVSAIDAAGRRRLDDPTDYVRREIETALAEGINLIPVLVEGATMPTADQLPHPLVELARRQAFELSERRWANDVGELAAHLQTLGVEPVHPPTPPPLRVPLMDAVGGYVPDLLLLLARPKTLIARRSLGRPQDLVRALVFLSVSLLLAFGLLLAVWPRMKISVPFFLGLAVVFGVGETLALSVPLYFAWWLAGARREYRRIVVPLCYQSAVTTLAVCAGFNARVTPLLLADPRLIERTWEVLLAPGDLAEKFAEAQRFASSGSDGLAAMVGVLLLVILLTGLAVWLGASWGAYRLSLGLSRWRSLAAFVTFMVLGPLAGYGFVALAVWLATARS